jgi:hypothetical protein
MLQKIVLPHSNADSKAACLHLRRETHASKGPNRSNSKPQIRKELTRMANGDDIEIGAITSGESTTFLNAQVDNDDGETFNGDVIFQVGPHGAPRYRPKRTLTGILGLGNSPGGFQGGGTGVAGVGGTEEGTGVHGMGGGVGNGAGGIGVHGAGGHGNAAFPNFTTLPGPGVIGQGGKLKPGYEGSTPMGYGAGVIGVAGSTGLPVPPFQETSNVGVFAQGAGSGELNPDGKAVGPADPGPGVLGRGGVRADGSARANGAGVVGIVGGAGVPSASDTIGVGVLGKADVGTGVEGRAMQGPGVKATCDRGNGVHAEARVGHAVFGDNFNAPKQSISIAPLRRKEGMSAVYGRTLQYRGVSGVVATEDRQSNQEFSARISARAIGVYGSAAFVESMDGVLTVKGYAGWFRGPVTIDGALVVTGPKSAALKGADGKHRLVYSVESPESWLEDFGHAKLSKGKCSVKLDRVFASSIDSGSYMVFLTPFGETKGLFVARRTAQGFEVRECQGGQSKTEFCYRIVGKRADVEAKRFADPKFPSGEIVSPRRGKPRAKGRSPR